MVEQEEKGISQGEEDCLDWNEMITKDQFGETEKHKRGGDISKRKKVS